MPTMQPEIVPKSFGCLPHKSLKLSLSRSRSRSSSSLSSPRTPRSPGGSTSSRRSSYGTKRDEYMEVFRRFDNDNDGKISAVELRSYFASIGEYMSHEDAQAVINDLDTDGDDLLDFQDFLRLMSKESEEQDLKAAFQMFEFEKGSGRITPKSLQRVLSRLGDTKSHEECAAMIQVFDTDGKGELGFSQFQEMMLT